MLQGKSSQKSGSLTKKSELKKTPVFGIIEVLKPLTKKGVCTSMITHFDSFEKTEIKFASAISELHIGKILKKVNILKASGHSPFEVFQFLLLLVFQ